MTRSFALIAGAFAATVAFSGASFAQSRPSDATLDSYVAPQAAVAAPTIQRSAKDLRQQRVNDLRQQTTFAGQPFATSPAQDVTLSAKDRALRPRKSSFECFNNAAAFTTRRLFLCHCPLARVWHTERPSNGNAFSCSRLPSSSGCATICG